MERHVLCGLETQWCKSVNEDDELTPLLWLVM